MLEITFQLTQQQQTKFNSILVFNLFHQFFFILYHPTHFFHSWKKTPLWYFQFSKGFQAQKKDRRVSEFISMLFMVFSHLRWDISMQFFQSKKNEKDESHQILFETTDFKNTKAIRLLYSLNLSFWWMSCSSQKLPFKKLNWFESIFFHSLACNKSTIANWIWFLLDFFKIYFELKNFFYQKENYS